MIVHVGIENNNEGYRTIAWALEYPGCFAYGKNAAEALGNLSVAVRDYSTWISCHEASWISNDSVQARVEDTWADYNINESFDRDPESDYYMVDAWFQHDWKPLIALDVERGLKLLAWSHTDLLALLKTLTSEQWTFTKAGERWDIAGIVKHIGGADWWYLDRLGLAFPRDEVPKEPLKRLEKVYARLVEVLPGLEGKNQVVGVDGEFWSPRKLLRRALWHERDHLQHIQKLL